MGIAEQLVSIVMPAYNVAAYVEESVKSVLSQTYRGWELIVVDDASSDDTCARVQLLQHGDDRIHLIRLPFNQGAGIARNRGIQEAKGDFVAFLDADDIWLSRKLELQLQHMAAREASVCYGSYLLIKENGAMTGQQVKALEKLSFSRLLKANYIGNLTGIYSVRELGKIYGPKLRKRQDWGLWLKVLEKSKVAIGVTEPIAKYRLRHDSLSGRKISMVPYNYAIYREVLGMSPGKSLIMLLRFMIEQHFVKSRQKQLLNQGFKLL